MNLLTVLGAGLLAGATTCAASQGGLLVGLIARQRRDAGAPASTGVVDDLVPVSGFLVGKLIAYTLLGAVLGALGSAVDLDARIGGLAQLVAGAAMVALGLGTMGVPGFRDITITPPASLLRLARRSTRGSTAAAPFVLGLATVLVPCGVTVSMELLAAASGSAAAGAAIMFTFVLGTAPMFVAFGFAAQRWSGTGHAVMGGLLGGLVLAMGLVTLNAGLTVLGAPVTAQTVAASVTGRSGAPAVAAGTVSGGVQTLTIDALSQGFSPDRVSAKAGLPTRLVLRTDDTRSCILSFVVPSMNVSTQLPITGETTVDLGTLPAGETRISCSMGMYTGAIVAS